MKKTLVLAASILAASVIHASANPIAEPTILQAGRMRIAHGQVCGQEGTNAPTATTIVGGPTSVTFATVQGQPGQWVADAVVRPSSKFPGFTNAVNVCLNAPADNGMGSTNPIWVSYLVVGPPPAP